jgi:hypothetical protein
MIKAYLGEKADTAHALHLVNIFLESAAINVPLSICTAVGTIMAKPWGNIIVTPGLTGQVCVRYLRRPLPGKIY